MWTRSLPHQVGSCPSNHRRTLAWPCLWWTALALEGMMMMINCHPVGLASAPPQQQQQPSLSSSPPPAPATHMVSTLGAVMDRLWQGGSHHTSVMHLQPMDAGVASYTRKLIPHSYGATTTTSGGVKGAIAHISHLATWAASRRQHHRQLQLAASRAKSRTAIIRSPNIANLELPPTIDPDLNLTSPAFTFLDSARESAVVESVSAGKTSTLSRSYSSPKLLDIQARAGLTMPVVYACIQNHDIACLNRISAHLSHFAPHELLAILIAAHQTQPHQQHPLIVSFKAFNFTRDPERRMVAYAFFHTYRCMHTFLDDYRRMHDDASHSVTGKPVTLQQWKNKSRQVLYHAERYINVSKNFLAMSATGPTLDEEDEDLRNVRYFYGLAHLETSAATLRNLFKQLDNAQTEDEIADAMNDYFRSGQDNIRSLDDILGAFVEGVRRFITPLSARSRSRSSAASSASRTRSPSPTQPNEGTAAAAGGSGGGYLKRVAHPSLIVIGSIPFNKNLIQVLWATIVRKRRFDVMTELVEAGVLNLARSKDDGLSYLQEMIHQLASTPHHVPHSSWISNTMVIRYVVAISAQHALYDGFLEDVALELRDAEATQYAIKLVKPSAQHLSWMAQRAKADVIALTGNDAVVSVLNDALIYGSLVGR